MRELSGRDLEIAVARALGGTVRPWHTKTDGTFYCLDFPDRACGSRLSDTEDHAWDEQTPNYLTDPDAFAEVIAALFARGLSRDTGRRESGQHAGSGPDPGIDWITALKQGITYHEAACRLLVAWEAQ